MLIYMGRARRVAPQASLGRGLSLVAGILLELGAAGLGEMAVPIVARCATRNLAVPPGCHVRAGLSGGTSVARAWPPLRAAPCRSRHLTWGCGGQRGRGQRFPKGWAVAHWHDLINPGGHFASRRSELMRKAEVERLLLCSKPRSQRGPGVAAPSGALAERAAWSRQGKR